MTDILIQNWAVVALALITAADAIVSLTPSKRDDQIVGYLRIIITSLTGKRRGK